MTLNRTLSAQLFPFIKQRQPLIDTPQGLDGGQGAAPVQPTFQSPQYMQQPEPQEQLAIGTPPPPTRPPMGVPDLSGYQAPGYDAQGQPNMRAPEIPQFGKPYIPEGASDIDKNKAMLDYWAEMRANPVNHDKGWKGLAKELAENFLYGLSKTQPGMNVTQALALGGTGAGAGFFNKGWNEQRRAEQEIPVYQDQLANATNQAAKEAQIQNLELQPQQKQQEYERKIAKDDVQRQYNEDRIRLGKDKADDLRYWREQLVDLRAKGLDQKDKEIVQAQQRIDELSRHNKVTESQRATQMQMNQQQRAVQNKMNMAKTSNDVAKAIQAITSAGEAAFKTPEEIKQKVSDYILSLDPSIRPK